MTMTLWIVDGPCFSMDRFVYATGQLRPQYSWTIIGSSKMDKCTFCIFVFFCFRYIVMLMIHHKRWAYELYKKLIIWVIPKAELVIYRKGWAYGPSQEMILWHWPKCSKAKTITLRINLRAKVPRTPFFLFGIF